MRMGSGLVGSSWSCAALLALAAGCGGSESPASAFDSVLDDAGDWQAFVTDHAELMPGYERPLAQALESVHLCAAMREASSDELVAAFDKI